MIDRQKVYNKVRKHLLKQNRAAYYHGACQYRTYDPTAKKVLKCAIGCLIPFRHYTPKIEGASIKTGRDAQIALAKSVPGISGEDLSFLSGLQDIHDQYEVEEWEHRLDGFAAAYGLDVVA